MLQTLERAGKLALDTVDPDDLATEITERLKYRIAKDPTVAKPHDWLTATQLVLRDRIIEAWIESTKRTYASGQKRVYYLSMEFLIGRLLRDSVNNLRMTEPVRSALAQLGVNYDEIAELEPDAALGNGGLGRLAACFMESMATVDVAATGYGIRYQHGLFEQDLNDGWQVERPETWLDHGNPWEFERREACYEIGFGGAVRPCGTDERGVTKLAWQPAEVVIATAYDTPVVGWRGKRINTLRLWASSAPEPIRLEDFNRGEHVKALEAQARADALDRVLYPADETPAGQELRLRQEYFFVAASLADILRRHQRQFGDLSTLNEHVAVQLNDTHPAIAVPELMRVLIDEHGMAFAEAWEITRATFSYTNHTLLPEALETWGVPLFERLLPRHMQLVYAINATVLTEAKADGASDDAIRAISLIDENGERRVRMGNLAFVGSHAINGVSALHTELMKDTVFTNLHRVYPSRIRNKTNGITPRRWLMECNPGLTSLIREAIGEAFLDDIDRLRDLEPFADDAGFREKFRAVKDLNKERMAQIVAKRTGVSVDPSAMFDVQIKRIHEYKRQLLNIIEAVALYDQIRSHPERNWVPRVKLFAGKAAPSYHRAKLIVKLMNDVGQVINNDPSVRGLLKVVFVPNYNVSLAERMVPAADLSEQVSTAGFEASGTGNMKFALNGALTIGTLDGANVEIKEHVGDDNIVIFGLTAAEVAQKKAGGYDPTDYINPSYELGQALRAIATGTFSPDDPNRYAELVNDLRHNDRFMLMADFDDYARAQREVDALWTDRSAWDRKAILNTARTGWFSSDRTIREYATDIWNVM